MGKEKEKNILDEYLELKEKLAVLERQVKAEQEKAFNNAIALLARAGYNPKQAKLVLDQLKESEKLASINTLSAALDKVIEIAKVNPSKVQRDFETSQGIYSLVIRPKIKRSKKDKESE